MELTGLHHVSALTAQAPRNLDFYTRTLGMRLIKKTVCASRAARRSITGRHALSSTASTMILCAENGCAVLPFRDCEGQRLALIDDSGAPMAGGTPWAGSPTPGAVGIRGLGTVTLTVRHLAPTARVLTDIMGFREHGRYRAADAPDHDVVVFATGPGGPGAEVHVAERPDLSLEQLGRGGVHHVAFRVPTIEEHAAWLARLGQAGLRNSGLIDRFYFQSIYFREPNGILFELATDGPGFAADEDATHLGARLALPPFLEPRRAQIEAHLQPLDLAIA